MIKVLVFLGIVFFLLVGWVVVFGLAFVFYGGQ